MSATQTKTQNKPKFIDFQELKQRIKIEDATPLLGLKVSQYHDQLRGVCPACKSGGDRALVITASKSVFYCFAAGVGGDVIALTSHVKGIGMKEAAAFLAATLSTSVEPTTEMSAATVPSDSSPKKEKAGLNPLKYLQTEHPFVQALGISPETASAFGAGYASKGIMRGSLAIPIHDGAGHLIAYCGYMPNEIGREMIFPKDFKPSEYIFNIHRTTRPSVKLLRNPFEVMLEFECGEKNAISFLTTSVLPKQLNLLVELLDLANGYLDQS